MLFHRCSFIHTQWHMTVSFSLFIEIISNAVSVLKHRMVWIMNLLFWSILSNTYCRFFAITILASSSIWFSTARLYRWMFNENATYQYDSLHWMSMMKKIFLSVSVLLSDWIVCEHWISIPKHIAYWILHFANWQCCAHTDTLLSAFDLFLYSGVITNTEKTNGIAFHVMLINS